MTMPSAMDRRATMPAIAHASGSSRKASALQSFGIRKKSDIDIVLDDKDDFIPSYSTFDEIKGHVNIRFEKDTLIDGLNIVFQGQADTWVEKMAAISPRTGRATAKHIFLRMQQPIDENLFSDDNIAKAGETYTIPFKFVVPESMLPFVCNHNTDSTTVKSRHLCLPPSIGDEMLAGEGSVLMDDLCPAMAKIVYSIRVALIKSSLNDRPRDVVSNSVRVQITPSRSELPPEIISAGNLDQCHKYQLRKEKNVRKGIFRLGKKSGRLTAETSQPWSIMLPHAQNVHKAAPSTSTTINLRYDPASADEEPPQLSSVESKLKSYTFFGAQPFKQLPNPTNYDVWSVMHSQYSVTVGLSNMNLTSVQWKKHEPGRNTTERVRQGSVATSTSSAKPVGRSMSTSTGTDSTNHRPASQGFGRPSSRVSDSSNDSYSPASSTTSLSSPTSPVMTGSRQIFPEPTIISPSTTYDSALPYYTASIIVPVTLPTIHKTTEDSDAGSRRPSHAPVDASVVASVSPTATISHPVPTNFGRKRNVPTFVPSFHSCLISRVYALDLTLHAANPAPQIHLRAPIQISSESRPSLSRPRSLTGAGHNQGPAFSAPLSWYDPYDISHLSLNPNTQPNQFSAIEADGQDTANDEAIAKALSAYNPNYAQTQTQTQYGGYPEDEIPSYAEIQTQTYDDTNTNQPRQQRRHNSVPLTTTSLSNYDMSPFSNNNLNSTSADIHDSELPPQYNATAGFRRKSHVVPSGNNITHGSSNNNSNNNNSSSSTTTATSTHPSSGGQSTRPKKSGSGWGKKLRLRN